MKQFVLKYKHYLAALLVLTAIALFVINHGAGDDTIQSRVEVLRGEVANEALVFGRSAAREVYELAFSRSGTLVKYPIQEGDKVKRGQLVARLNSRVLEAKITQAARTIEIEEARFAELDFGISSQEEEVVQLGIAKQQIVTDGDERDLRHKIEEIAEEMYRLVEQKIDTHYIYPSDSERTLLRLKSVEDLSEDLREALSRERVEIENWYRTSWAKEGTQAYYEQFVAWYGQVDSLARTLEKELEKEDTLEAEQAKQALEGLVGLIALKRDEVATQYTRWRSANEELALQQSSLRTQKSGADESARTRQLKVIRARESDKQALVAELAELTLRAPLDGVVFRTPLVNYQTVQAQETVVEIVPNEPLVVYANVAESDVAFVGVGNEARVVFDALGGKAFAAEVARVDKQEQRGQTVPVYEAMLVFATGQDISAIRSGMTATVEVRSGVREGVLYIPTRFIERSEDRFWVIVEDEGGSLHPRTISLGLESNTGVSEVVSGLDAGEQVVRIK